MLFDGSNLPYWILLGLGVALFLFVIVSGGGDDDLDVDADADIDADADGGNPVDFDADSDSDFSPLQVLGWLGLGKAPLILLLATDLSLWGVLGWLTNVIIGGLVGGVVSGLIGGAVLLGSLSLSLLAGGQIARPIGKIFASFGEDASGDRLVGCIGTVSTGKIPKASDNKIGQVDVVDPAKNLVTVNAVLPDWAAVLPSLGDKVLIIEHHSLTPASTTSSTYSVIVKDSVDQDAWFANHSR